MSSGDDDPTTPGGTLSHYRIVERLGEGAMGVVVRAHDLELDRDVALKLPRSEQVADPKARARLIEEARIASRLSHPNICTIHEVGQAGDHVFIAMELVEGRPLAELIPPDGLPDETVVRLAAPVARALAHAHARGVVHRDLKTGNIVVGADGRPKLLDFGLSRREPAAGAVAEASSAGVVVGTPRTLAPELLRGARASEASDVWSLGVVLHEMCAGSPPFAGEHMAALVTAILHDPPAPLPAHAGSGLRAVVTRCLAKDPLQRYRSADEVAAALEALAAGAGPRPRGRRRMWAGWIVSLVLLAGAVPLALDLGGWRTRLTGGSPIRSLAVLPLVNLPSDPAQEYFADGMTEQLIADLAQIRGLRVISRTSVMRFKGTTTPLAEIIRTLRVDAVVEGSVQRDSGLVRIRVRLVDARSEEPLWAASFDRPLRDVLALQSEVAQEVTDRIRTHLSGAERERLVSSADVDPEAFDHYLRGRYALSRSPSAVAIAEFRQAIAIDAGYSRAYAGLAHALVRAQALGDSTVEAVRAPALAAAARAVELDGDSAEGFLAQANVKARLEWDIPGAERSARRALDLAPGDAEAHHTYGLLAGVQGRLDECIAELKRARERDPLNPYYHEQLGQALIYARRDDRAISELGRMLVLFPGDRAGLADLGWAYLEKGDVDRAIATLEALPGPHVRLGCAYARAGRGAEARHLLTELEERWRGGRAPASDVALVYAALGERDRAFEWLERARAAREYGFLTLPFDPGFDALRTDPRYVALLARHPMPPR